jgi:DNA-binding PadR family transcriptional regulator
MTKLGVLRIFARVGRFARPDEVWNQLARRLDRRSVYSYLDRLRRQGLLERLPNPRRGQLAYRLTPRGVERLAYLEKTRVLPPSV